MQPPDERIWCRIPGQTDSDEDSDSEEAGRHEERERKARAKKGLEEIAATLGDKWIDVPCIDFSPAPPGFNSNCPPGRLPPSQWSGVGPPLSFRIEHVRAPVVQNALMANGMTQTKGKEWLVMWSGPRMRDKEYQGLHELQRVNHFPGSTELTRKDRICVHFQNMARRFGSGGFNFLPETYVLPKEVEQFREVYQNNKKHIWIVKPSASSQGKGIFLLRDLDELATATGETTVVSRYIDNPLLIQGLKFDLRIYVLVTSFEPLRAYVYREGLTRFASSPYSTDDEHLNDAFRHLTNYSINKKAENFVENQQTAQDNVGHKWSFSAFNKHLKHVGVNIELMWARILDLCLKTLISVRPSIAAETRKATPHSANCFELYGFDVLVDDVLKPWLIEVNLSPSMMAESPLDMQVKSAVLSDTFNLIGVSNASWRALSTAKLRGQLVQMRQSMAMASQNAAACRAGQSVPAEAGGQDHEGGAVRLAELPERDLKLIAQALKETGRCNNFIRLYPTPSTVKRYAPLMRAPSPTSKLLLRMLLGADVLIPDADICTTDLEPSKKELAEAEAEAEAKAVADRLAKEKAKRDEEYLDWSDINPEVSHSPARVATAMPTLKALNMKLSARIVLIEYLVRITNVCRALRMKGRAKLAQSKAYKGLAAFRHQLAVFIRAKDKKGTASPKSLPSIEDIDNDFIDQLVATCRATIALISKEMFVAASALGPLPLSPEGRRAQLSLPAQLPPAFATSSRGEYVIEKVQGLSSGDLECILQGPGCVPEIASLLGSAAVRDSEEFGGFEEFERIIKSCGTACGPLSDLLHAVRPVELATASTGAPSPKMESLTKSSSMVSLPSIFSSATLMSQAARSSRHLQSNTPTWGSLAGSRSTGYPAQRHLATQRIDSGSPLKVPAMSHTKSLPTIQPMSSPAKKSYLNPRLTSFGRSKQPLDRPCHISDFMHTDLEF